MIHLTSNSTKNVRGVYIIDPENVIQSITFYPMTVGRNLEELKRTVLALQTAKDELANTPANWVPGEDVLVPYKLSTEKENEAAGIYDVAWFMTSGKKLTKLI